MVRYDLDLSMGLRGYTGAAQHRKPKRVKTRRARGSLAYYPYCDFLHTTTYEGTYLFQDFQDSESGIFHPWPTSRSGFGHVCSLP